MAVVIASLPADRWGEYRSIRLESLLDSPFAFTSTHAQAIEFADSVWKDRLLQGNPKMLFAFHDDAIVGIVGAYAEEGKGGGIISLYVTPTHRGHGVARDLMRTAIDHLWRNSTVIGIGLTVNASQIGAVRLYEELGFRPTKSYSDQMGDGREHIALEMWLERTT